MGKISEKASAKNGNVNKKYHNATGPPPAVAGKCAECGGIFHVRVSSTFSIFEGFC
jgi:hypothetical protein